MTLTFFGTILSTNKPGNAFVSTTMAYVGSHQKLTEKDLSLQPINMGARGYIPKLGRFLQVDPVEGGVQNDYVYPVDPINEFDLTGEFAFVPVAIVLGRIAVQAAAPMVVKHLATKHWSAGRFGNAAFNAVTHYGKHAKEIGARGFHSYTRSAWNTVRHATDMHTYKIGRKAYLDTRGRITVLNSTGKLVTHYKPKAKDLINHWNSVRKR